MNGYLKDRLIFMCRRSWEAQHYGYLERMLDDIARTQQAGNLLASVSSLDFAHSFYRIAKIICYRSPVPNTEKYIELCGEAYERIVCGESESDVLHYFMSLVE